MLRVTHETRGFTMCRSMTDHACHISAARSILHVDMDAFFAAIAELDDPTLRGEFTVKLVIVVVALRWSMLML